MSGRHDQRGGNASQVEVSQLIERVAQEGRPVRLSWSARIVPEAVYVEEWPTGELLRLPPGPNRNTERCGSAAPAAQRNQSEPDELWGNRGPRPYQDVTRTPTSWFDHDAEPNRHVGRYRCG